MGAAAVSATLRFQEHTRCARLRTHDGVSRARRTGLGVPLRSSSTDRPHAASRAAVVCALEMRRACGGTFAKLRETHEGARLGTALRVGGVPFGPHAADGEGWANASFASGVVDLSHAPGRRGKRKGYVPSVPHGVGAREAGDRLAR